MRVEPVDEQPPAAVVLGDHPLHVRLAASSAATSAASWATVGADMIPYWWTFTIPSRIAAGAATSSRPASRSSRRPSRSRP